MIGWALLKEALGFAALGVAYPIVGNSAWLLAFVIPAYVVGFLVALANV